MYGYATALVLNERQPTVSRESLRTTDSPGADIAGTRLDQAYAFSFQVLRPMGLTSMEYTLSPESNLQTLDKRTAVRGGWCGRRARRRRRHTWMRSWAG